MNTAHELAEGIEHLHGGRAIFVETVAVLERFEDQIVWDGEVHVFELQGHPTANRAYAWSTPTEEGRSRVTAVLHQAPVDSPQAAVQAAIVAHVRACKNA